MEQYEASFLPPFVRHLRQYPDQAPRVHRFLERLLTAPYEAGGSHPLGDKEGRDLRGKRGAHVSRNFVIVFMVCEECMHRGYREQGFNACEPCPEAPLKRVMLLAFGPHKKAYGHTWGG